MIRQLWGSLFFMLAGLLYIFIPLINPDLWHNRPYPFVGWFFLFLSLIQAFYSVKRLITTKPGFLISGEGIHDCAGSQDAGPILWSDIRDIKLRKVFWGKMIVIYVHEPQAHINKQRNWITKLNMSLNHVFFDSPFCIGTRNLDISLNDLFEVIDRTFKVYREK